MSHDLMTNYDACPTSSDAKCAVPTLFLYPCGGDVLIVESNYDNYNEHSLRGLLASEVIKVFLVKVHHQNTKIRRTGVNFNNTFSENLIHNMIEVKFNTIKKVKDEWEQCWHLG